jgi:hypothetical protein
MTVGLVRTQQSGLRSSFRRSRYTGTLGLAWALKTSVQLKGIRLETDLPGFT